MTTKMVSTEISFEKQFNGYDRGQVDRYIASLAKAYQTAYDEYNAVNCKYKGLLEDYKNLEAKEQSKPNADVIAKTLISSEELAKKIISNAEKEAATIIIGALADGKSIIDDANAETAKIQEASQKMIADANAEAAVAHEKAKKIIDNANLEAARLTAQSKKGREQSDEIITRMICEMQGILEPQPPDNQTGKKPDLSYMIPLIASKTGS